MMCAFFEIKSHEWQREKENFYFYYSIIGPLTSSSDVRLHLVFVAVDDFVAVNHLKTGGRGENKDKKIKIKN